jgi:cytochrome c5
MNARTRIGLLASLAIASASPALAQSTDAAAAPAKPEAAAPSGTAAEYSPELVAKGEGLVGPNLTDAEWIHSKGSYDEIVAQIDHGVPKAESKSGIEMPPKGGATLSDDDVKAIAAYVYSLSHK